MGYDLHITRKSEWFDEKGEEITLEEWCEFVENSKDMRLDGYAETKMPAGTLKIESEGLSVWTGYSGHEKGGNMAWFSYFSGNINVKNPDEEIIKQMFQVALALNAKVQGEEGEIYGENGKVVWNELRVEGDTIQGCTAYPAKDRVPCNNHDVT